MPTTGGPLNKLNGAMAISAPHNSVPVMKLIKAHRPMSRSALVDLIEYHHINDCSCGIKSQGTVYDFGQNLYKSQKEYWGEYRYSLAECIQWEYDLFITNSLKGSLMEKKALSALKSNSQITFLETNGYIDEDLRIDILANHENDDIAGIQVKPSSYKKMRQNVKRRNTIAHQKWNKPVYYLYYDDKESFENIQEIKESLSALIVT